MAVAWNSTCSLADQYRGAFNTTASTISEYLQKAIPKIMVLADFWNLSTSLSSGWKISEEHRWKHGDSDYGAISSVKYALDNSILSHFDRGRPD